MFPRVGQTVCAAAGTTGSLGGARILAACSNGCSAATILSHRGSKSRLFGFVRNGNCAGTQSTSGRENAAVSMNCRFGEAAMQRPPNGQARHLAGRDVSTGWADGGRSLRSARRTAMGRSCLRRTAQGQPGCASVSRSTAGHRSKAWLGARSCAGVDLPRNEGEHQLRNKKASGSFAAGLAVCYSRAPSRQDEESGSRQLRVNSSVNGLKVLQHLTAPPFKHQKFCG
jgi:hypothetical protein